MKSGVDNTKKQNILIVHNYYQIPGGEDTVVANEKKMLEAHGHKVVLYSRNNSELKSMSKWKKLILPLSTVFNLKTYRDVKRLIRVEHIDIVHVHNTLTLVSPSVYYAAKAMKIPVVQTVHNFRLLCPGATFYRDGHICEECVTKGLMYAVKHNCYRGSKLQTLACVVSTTIHRLTGIYGKISYICLTEFNKEKLLQLKQIKADRVFVKPNFVETATDEIVPYNKRENTFIFAGRLDKLKGINILFDAWRQMGKTAPKLIICGTGSMEEWCRKFLIDYPECNIEMKGFVPNKETKKLIANSKALILPTQWYEGFPVTILEAYSAGTPVIGSNIGNVANLINSSLGATFIYNSPESLINVISHCNFKSEIIEEYYRENYSEDKNYSMQIQCYKRAAG